jgi:hypothetical protein
MEEYQAIENAALAQRQRLWDQLVGASSSESSGSSSETWDSDSSCSSDSGRTEFFQDLMARKLTGSRARPNSPNEGSGPNNLDPDSDITLDDDPTRPPRYLISRMNKAEKELLEDVANMRFHRKQILNKPAVVQKYFSRAVLKALQPYPDLLGHFTNLIDLELYSIPSRVDQVVMTARMRRTPPPPETVEEREEPKQASTTSDDEATSDNALESAYSVQRPSPSSQPPSTEPEQATQDALVDDGNAASDEVFPLADNSQDDSNPSQLHSAEPGQSTKDPIVSVGNTVSTESLPLADNSQDTSQLSQPPSAAPVAGSWTSQPQPEILVRPSSPDSIAQSDTSQLQPPSFVDPFAPSDTLQPRPDILPRPYSIGPAESPIPGDVQRRLSADLAPNPSPALSNDAGETPGNLTQLTERLEFVQHRANEAGVVPQSRFGTPALSPFATPARSQRATPAQSRFATPINVDDDVALGIAGPSSSSHSSHQQVLPHANYGATDSPPRRPSLPLLQPRPINPNPEHNHRLVRGPSDTLPIRTGRLLSLPLPQHSRAHHPGHDNLTLVEPPTLDHPGVDIQPAFGAWGRRRSSRIQEVYEENDVVGESRTRRASDSESNDLKTSKKFRARIDSMWQWPGGGNGKKNGDGDGPRKGSGDDGVVSR